MNRHKQLVAGGHEGGMEELKDFVDKKVCSCVIALFFVCFHTSSQLLEGQERKRLIDLHMQLSQVVFAELKKRNTSDLSFLEEAIIGNSCSDAKKQVLALLSPPAASAAAPDKAFHPIDKLRLVQSLSLLVQRRSLAHISILFQAMIYLIASQPLPSAQDFSDLEQALIGSGVDEDVQAKTEKVKSALQWVKR